MFTSKFKCFLPALPSASPAAEIPFFAAIPAASDPEISF